MQYPRLVRNGTAPRTGIVHFGPGAFFRAFNAIYTDESISRNGGDWGITAVSLKSASARDQLLPQKCVYTAVELSPSSKNTRIVGSVNNVLVAPEDPVAVLDVMADPAVKIVSLTVTEKGYCHNPADGKLNIEHPDIVADLADIEQPKSVPGLLVAALARRRALGIKAFSVLSCDNLPANGKLIRGIVLDFAHRLDQSLARWIEHEVTFPCTMVDRITPATTQHNIESLAETTGYFDPGCVVHEPFRQWVIEDKFVNGRPAWDTVGAQCVASVDAHELMKLRCLNGTHSTLAYLGYMAGCKTISETVANPVFAEFCEYLWAHEIIPTLTSPEGEDVSLYCRTLLQRYRNPSIQHQTWQIAMDGSQKLPQRLLGTIADNLDTDLVPKGLCLAVAGWMRYVGGVDEKGERIDVRDPYVHTLKSICEGTRDPAHQVSAMLALNEIFDPELVLDARFSDAVTEAYLGLLEHNTLPTLRKFLTR